MTSRTNTAFPEPGDGLSFISTNGAAGGQGFDKLGLFGVGFWRVQQ